MHKQIKLLNKIIIRLRFKIVDYIHNYRITFMDCQYDEDIILVFIQLNKNIKKNFNLNYQIFIYRKAFNLHIKKS